MFHNNMKDTPPNRHKLFLSTCSIFTLCGFLTILFVVFNFPFSFIIAPLIICVTGLVIFSAYGVCIFYRSFNSSQGVGETTHLLQVRDNLESGLTSVSDETDESTENCGRKQSLPLPTPKPRVTYQHPTPMPQQSYLTELFMAKFRALGDLIRSRRHTVSESDVIGLDNITVDHLKSSRVHTKSESEIVNQTTRCSPNGKARRKQLLLNRDEDLFEMDFGADQYDKGYKES